MIEQPHLIEEEQQLPKIFTDSDRAILWQIAQAVAAFPRGFFCPFCRSMGADHKTTCIVMKARELMARESEGVQ